MSLMRLEYILTTVLFFFSLLIFGQQKMDFTLQNFIQQHPEKSDMMVDLAVEGDLESLVMKSRDYRMKIKHTSSHYLYIRIPLSAIHDFAEEKAVKAIYFDNYEPEMLADTMLVKNNVLPIIQLQEPFIEEVRGKGVLMGFVDAGIDYSHPDFWDDDGNSRIISIWDQTQADDAENTPSKYGYGREWTNEDIMNGTIDHDDQPQHWGHGSTVTGIAVSNGFAIMKNESLLNELKVTGKVGEDFRGYRGVAPDVKIVAVSSDFSRPNWTMTVADAVDYIFRIADSLDMPCVINTSVGSYLGSHDGRDPAGLFIDSLVTAKPGRAVVAAVGNSGDRQYHVGYDVTADTAFTWLDVNPNASLGYPAMFFDLWSDKDDLEDVHFTIGADDADFNFREHASFITLADFDEGFYEDSIVVNGNKLAPVEYYLSEMNDVYRLQVLVREPDSANYHYRFMTTGSGRVDFWSGEWINLSKIIHENDLPQEVVDDPGFQHYKSPDNAMSIVSSWACSPNVITVANYQNKNQYIDYNGNLATFSGVPDALASNSSHGPTRDGRLKPEIAATGGITLSTARLATAQNLIQNSPDRVAPGGYHTMNGGSSMAAPVVAGGIALYYELCPSHRIEDVFDTFFENTKTDQHTGSTPNTSWGYGKLDVYNSIKDFYFKPGIQVVGETAFCDGDSVGLEIEEGYEGYYWQDNDTGRVRAATVEDEFIGFAVNELGCAGRTDAVPTTVHPLPEKPEIINYVNSNAMLTDEYVAYQWYRNDAPIPNAHDRTLVADQSGYYHVRVFNAHGCYENSDTIAFNLKNETERLATIYPNPALDFAQLIIHQEAEYIRYQITDRIGKTVAVNRIDQPQRFIPIEINVSGLSDGIYFIQVTDGQQSETIRFLKMNRM